MAQNGDKGAKDELFNENTGLIYMVVKRFLDRGYERDELFQIGAIGLLKAIERFDLTSGHAFSTYAVPLIVGEIRRFIRDDNMIHISRKIIDDARKIAVVREEMQKTNNKELTMEEVRQLTGLSFEEIAMATDAYIPMSDIDEVRAIHTNDNNEQVIDSITVNQLLMGLSSYDRRLVILRYIEQKTQRETAEILGINQVKVSRLEREILTKMRHKMSV